MVKVQASPEHNYYLDGYLKANLDALKKNVKKDYDAFVLIVGREGFGKSTLAMQLAMYCDPTFNIDRVCFTSEQFLEAVDKTEKYQAIVFDETMGYLSSRGAMSKFNKVLIKVMSEMRSKNLFVFLCIPNFFIMDWYVAQHRTTGLIYIYKRTAFGSYDYPTKKNLYLKGKKYRSYCVPPNFRGSFVKYFPIDKEEYERRKQAAISEWSNITKKEGVYKQTQQRNWLINYLHSKDILSKDELSAKIGLSEASIKEILRKSANLEPTEPLI